MNEGDSHRDLSSSSSTEDVYGQETRAAKGMRFTDSVHDYHQNLGTSVNLLNTDVSAREIAEQQEQQQYSGFNRLSVGGEDSDMYKAGEELDAPDHTVPRGEITKAMPGFLMNHAVPSTASETPWQQFQPQSQSQSQPQPQPLNAGAVFKSSFTSISGSEARASFSVNPAEGKACNSFSNSHTSFMTTTSMSKTDVEVESSSTAPASTMSHHSARQASLPHNLNTSQVSVEESQQRRQHQQEHYPVRSRPRPHHAHQVFSSRQPSAQEQLFQQQEEQHQQQQKLAQQHQQPQQQRRWSPGHMYSDNDSNGDRSTPKNTSRNRDRYHHSSMFDTVDDNGDSNGNAYDIERDINFIQETYNTAEHNINMFSGAIEVLRAQADQVNSSSSCKSRYSRTSSTYQSSSALSRTGNSCCPLCLSKFESRKEKAACEARLDRSLTRHLHAALSSGLNQTRNDTLSELVALQVIPRGIDNPQKKASAVCKGRLEELRAQKKNSLVKGKCVTCGRRFKGDGLSTFLMNIDKQIERLVKNMHVHREASTVEDELMSQTLELSNLRLRSSTGAPREQQQQQPSQQQTQQLQPQPQSEQLPSAPSRFTSCSPRTPSSKLARNNSFRSDRQHPVGSSPSEDSSSSGNESSSDSSSSCNSSSGRSSSTSSSSSSSSTGSGTSTDNESNSIPVNMNALNATDGIDKPQYLFSSLQEGRVGSSNFDSSDDVRMMVHSDDDDDYDRHHRRQRSLPIT